MRQVGRCDCGEKGIKIKLGSSVCERCDRIENTIAHDLHKISEAEKRRNKDNIWARYHADQYRE